MALYLGNSGKLKINFGNTVCTLNLGSVKHTPEPAYINQIPISTDASGATFNGKGWKENTKLSSSSGAETSGSAGVTGYIPIGIGSGNNVHGEQVIYLANIEALPSDASNVRISFYDANKTHNGTVAANGMSATNAESKVSYTLDANGYIVSLDVGAYTSYLSRNLSKDTAFFRLSAPGLDGDSIITVNQPIVSDEPETEPKYINQIPLSVNADGSEYIGTNGEDGYKVGYRVNSSGNELAVSGMCCTGYIPYTTGQVIRLKNVTISGASTPYIVECNADKSLKQVESAATKLIDDGNGVYTGAVTTACSWIRISCGVINDTSILTLDEEIV